MKVAVFFGGKSVEHEVSVISGLQVCRTLLLEHEVIPVYITKNNQMYVDDNVLSEEFYIENQLNKNKFVRVENINKPLLVYKHFPYKKLEFDIALLCVHGKGVEDGSLSGLFEFLDIPFVGPSVQSSSLAQNKYMTKKMLKSSSIDVINFDLLKTIDLKEKDVTKINRIGYPIILKANNLGSSIGVEIAHNYEELKEYLEYILKYDNEVIIEKYIQNRKEYNISLFKHKDKLEISLIDEVIGSDILSYDDKYLENDEGMVGCKRVCPAKIKNSLKKEIEYQAKKIYYSLGYNSLVRLDFIFDESEKKLYFNEANSIPGSYAYYLYKDKYSFLELLNLLIDNAFFEYKNKVSLIRTIDNNRIYERNKGLKFK